MKKMPMADAGDGESVNDTLARIKAPLAGKTAHEIVRDAKDTAATNRRNFTAQLARIATPAYLAPAPAPAEVETREEVAQTSAPAAVEEAVAAPMPASVKMMIPLEQIDLGGNVRKVLGNLDELVESVKRIGILQSPIVRPNGNRFELVAGYRRVAAAKQAGLTELAVDVRTLTDAQVVEVQLVENIQRQTLDPLDEADGFDRLHKEFGHSTATIAARVGKSIRWVQTHMQLTKLCSEGRRALADRKIVVEIAMTIANIPSQKLQAEAVEKVTTPIGLEKERMSARAAKDFLRENYTTELRGAPFNTKDALLVPEAGACTACPKRSGANPDLFGDDFKRADICTDVVCFKGKKQAAWEEHEAKAKAEGKKVLSLTEGAKIFRHGTPSHDSAWVDLNAVCPEDPKKRTWIEVLGEKSLEARDGEEERSLVTVAPDLTGHVHQIVKKEDALQIAKANGLKWATRAAELEVVRKPPTKEEAEKREHDAALQSSVETAVIGKAVDWVEKNGSSPAIFRMMGFGLSNQHRPDVLERRKLATDRDLVALIEKTNSEKVLFGIVFELCVSEWIRGFNGYSDELKAMAKMMKIDLDAIEKAQSASLQADSLFDQKKPKK
jgi:ParB/RepB/Spo0J family partition protein